MRHAVIGSGLVGLTLAQAMRRRGERCLLIDRAARVGGVWRRPDPASRLGEAACAALGRFSPASGTVGGVLDAADFQCESLCDAGVEVQLSREAVRIRPADSYRRTGQWNVTFADGATEEFASVSLCVGGEPIEADCSLLNGFTGKLVLPRDPVSARPMLAKAKNSIVIGAPDDGVFLADGPQSYDGVIFACPPPKWGARLTSFPRKKSDWAVIKTLDGGRAIFADGATKVVEAVYDVRPSPLDYPILRPEDAVAIRRNGAVETFLSLLSPQRSGLFFGGALRSPDGYAVLVDSTAELIARMATLHRRGCRDLTERLADHRELRFARRFLGYRCIAPSRAAPLKKSVVHKEAKAFQRLLDDVEQTADIEQSHTSCAIAPTPKKERSNAAQRA